MIVVLVVAAGAPWESTALTTMAEHPGLVVLKRCVDVDDLLATASAGQAQVAVLGLDAPGLDTAAVDHLRGCGVRPVAVVHAGAEEAGRVRAGRIGIADLVPDDRLGTLAEVLTSPEQRPPDPQPVPPVGPPGPDAGAGGPAGAAGPGRVLVVWGAGGGAGRSTLAGLLAAEIARRGHPALLVDADPHGGALAQQLGVLDEVSGLLAAARLAASGLLEERFSTVPRGLSATLSLVTGLPRPDRWVEVRSGVLDHLLDLGRARGDVVVDTGFSLELDPGHDLGTRPGRNHLTTSAVEAADEVLVVGSADPVGLSRLVRGLSDLRELVPGTPVRVVVNRMRPTLGWSERDIAGMVGGFVRPVGLHFLPDDPAAVDRALVTGRTVLEGGETPLTRAVAGLVDPAARVDVAGRA